jgi:DNA-binding transcriptional ArsR family regulator
MISPDPSERPTDADTKSQRDLCDVDSLTGATNEDGPQEKPSLDVQTMWELLSNKRRRLTILALAEHGRGYTGMGPYVSIGSIADVLVTASRGSPNRKSVYVCLYQTHLDQLEEAGIIEYNEQGTKVRPQLPLYYLESILLEMEQVISNFPITEVTTSENPK